MKSQDQLKGEQCGRLKSQSCLTSFVGTAISFVQNVTNLLEIFASQKRHSGPQYTQSSVLSVVHGRTTLVFLSIQE